MRTYENPYKRRRETAPEGASLHELTKAELIEEAERRGVDVTKSATKAEILDALS